MAARGILPLSSGDQVAVLYQLAQDADASLAQAARGTAASLPEKLVAGTLADPGIDPRVLDWFAEHVAGRVAVFDAIVMNPGTADSTIAGLAAKGGAREVDLISQNEQRILRHPEIIAAMYMNRRARMATIDRVVELAVRNQVRVPGLAAWDEVARALTGGEPSSSKDDALIQRVLEASDKDGSAVVAAPVLSEDDEDDVKAPEREVPFRELSTPAKIRAVLLGNAEVRAIAVRDPSRVVAMTAIKSPNVTESEAARYAGNRNLVEDVIRYIATKREWTSSYEVKVSLCRNPKTPITESARWLPSLRERDLDGLSKSRNIPSALVAQARKLVMARRGGRKP